MGGQKWGPRGEQKVGARGERKGGATYLNPITMLVFSVLYLITLFPVKITKRARKLKKVSKTF